MKNKFIAVLLTIVFLSANLFAQNAPQISASLLKKAKQSQSGIQTMSADGGKIDVLFYPVDKNSENIDESFFKSRGIEYIKSRNYLSARVPVDMIAGLDKIPGVEYIDFDYMPRPMETVSEGRSLINASEYVFKGVNGAGVSIAVMDIGFADYRYLQSIGELPANLVTQKFSYNDFEYSEHGSACAEIVYDIVPGAKMYLIQVSGIAALQSAFDYCKANDIKVVSGSFGYVTDFFCDGTGKAAQIASSAFDSGILPVFAAGNQGQVSWFGKFNAQEGEWLIFPDGKDYLEVYAFSESAIYMMWDDFTQKNKKYTLYMYDAYGVLIDSSFWNAGNNPSVFVANNGGAKMVRLKIKKENPYENLNIRLFFDGATYMKNSDIVSESSLCSPADSRKVLAVGAISTTKWHNGPLENYNSRGPVQKTASLPQEIKPDIMGPTKVSTVMFGTGNFDGTSAATPHIAASAALLLSLDRTMTARQLREQVMGYAKQVASSPDNNYGYGKLSLGAEKLPESMVGDIICYPNPASISKNGKIKITNLPYNTTLIDINVFTVTGEFVKSFNAGDLKAMNGRMTIEWNLKNQNGDKIAPGIYFFVINTPASGKKTKKIAVQK